MPRTPRRARSAWTKRVMGGLPATADLPLGPVALPRAAQRLPGARDVRESDVLRACLALAAVHPRVGWVRRMNVGGVSRRNPDGSERWIQFGFTGCSDIVGMMSDGRFLAIEVKKPGGRLTREQEAFLGNVAAWGGVACCVDTVEALKRVLDRA